MTSLGDAADKRPRTHSWNVAFERRLPLASVNIAYVGNKFGRRTRTSMRTRCRHWAVATPIGRTCLAIRAAARHQRVDAVWEADVQLASAWRQPADDQGLLLKGHYTFSRAWIMGTSYELQTPEFQARNWAPQSGQPRSHRSDVVRLSAPVDQRHEPAASGSSFINDWQVSGVLSAFSGMPFTVTADATQLNTPGNTMTADLVGTLTKVGKIGADGVYYDPAAFAQPVRVCLGNTMLNQFTGPGGWNLDFSVMRSFPLGGSRRLETRIEASNVTDTPKFANPN